MDSRKLGIRGLLRISVCITLLVALPIFVTISKMNVTNDELARAEASMNDELTYLCLQLEAAQNRARAFDTLASSSGVTSQDLEVRNPEASRILTDPIGDMLTRIRNANMVKHESVEMPSSKMKIEIAKILKKEGYIRDFRYYKFQNKFNLKIFLKYGEKNSNILKGIERVSKPGRRIYSSKENIEKVLGGLGISILTTSKGVLTDKEARNNNVGGEVICRVW